MCKLATKFRPQADAFETAQRAGIRCVEFWLDANVLRQWQAVAALARRYPFRYALHFPNRSDLQPSSLRHAVNLYRELDCSAMVIHQPMFDSYGSQLKRLEPSIRLAVENHRLDDTNLHRWARQSPGLTLDVEHLWKFTLRDSPLDHLVDQLDLLLSRYVEKIYHVHLPGYLAGGDEHRPMHHGRQMALAALSLLADHGYRRLIVSEANEAYQNLNELAGDVRLYQSWMSQRAIRN